MVVFTSACFYSNIVKGSENSRQFESFTLTKSPYEWWVARHWRKNGQDTYLTTHTRRTPATGARVFSVFLEDIAITFDETEAKFRAIKQDCQTYELKSVVSEKEKTS